MNKLTLIPLLTLLSAGTAMAQTAPAPTSRMELRQEIRAQETDALITKLGLDAAQAASFKATLSRFDAQAMPLRQDARQTRRALKQELSASAPDQSKVASLTAQLLKDRAQLKSLGEQRMETLKAQLSPTQFATLVTSRREMGRKLRHDLRNAQRGSAPQE